VGNYVEVLEAAAHINMPSYFHTQALRRPISDDDF
jgi:hypothetical protein